MPDWRTARGVRIAVQGRSFPNSRPSRRLRSGFRLSGHLSPRSVGPKHLTKTHFSYSLVMSPIAIPTRHGHRGSRVRRHIPPFATLSAAATNIQSAIDAAAAGGTVLVDPGTYNRSTYSWYGIPNRIGIDKPLSVQAIAANPAVTVIDGENTMRCVYMDEDSRLSGFRITRGSADRGAGVFSNGEMPRIVLCCS